MRRLQLWRFVALLLLALGMVSAVHAQGKALYWQRLDVDITVNEDGTFRVVETQEIVFTRGTFTYGYRDVDMSRLDSISDVEVREGDRVYQRSDSGAPYTFRTSRAGQYFRIKWHFPETGDSTHTYTIAYTVHGGLRYYDGGQIWWKAVFPDRSFPVNSSQVTVHLPRGAEVLKFDSYGSTATTQLLDARMLIFTADRPIEPGKELEVRVQFALGREPTAAPPSSRILGKPTPTPSPRTWLEESNLSLGMIIGAGAVVLMAAILTIILWRRRRQPPCPHCGTPYEPRARFCMPCGRAIPSLEGGRRSSQVTWSEEVTMFCHKCGTQNPDTAKFCIQCGTPLLHPPEPAPSSGVPPRQRGRGWPISGAGAALVLICFFLTWISVSCGSEQILEVSGQELAAGVTFFGEKAPGQPILWLTLLAALICLIIAGAAYSKGSMSRSGAIGQLLLATAGLIAMLVVYLNLRS